MEWYFAVAVIIGTCAPVFLYRKENFSPENVLRDEGDHLLILGYPRYIFSKHTGRALKKSFVHKIQIADQIVTFFNESDNAVDLMLPSNEIAEPIFQRAKKLFPEAEYIEIKLLK
ncbi:hypothetical protein JQC92_15830 [Shewanella sp. 202IG2-18]|uniref:hypothetical protein n=1 Tax=Parashewanella hymeniacidonis TaxID=2807618 RepID=UPI00195FCA2C|nr:hypothetical protein [Parashewanella hymeniacidonis]MBM7073484.1 hypothetical protein [Parashewanella hymeniacidonis]